MRMNKPDKRTVMTLDAGGTNLVFSAVQKNREVVEPITLPADAGNLDQCLGNICEGFRQVRDRLKEPPVAISFAFPGPADYPNGIIGDLGNLPAFRGGVALGPMLKEKFGIPVFINNDGDLFVYGEALAGLLPRVNMLLSRSGSPKIFRNLFGVTLGTGFGAGLVHNGELYLGDNSAGAEIWLVRNKKYPDAPVEESASIRAVQREYAALAGIAQAAAPSPKEIFEIATGAKQGNWEAAVNAYKMLGEAVGDALANAVTLLDTLVVIGGGLAGAQSLFLSDVVREMNSSLRLFSGQNVGRTELKAYNLEDAGETEAFLKGDVREIQVPGSDQKMLYDPQKRIGVGLSVLGTSRAVSVGACAFALHALDRKLV